MFRAISFFGIFGLLASIAQAQLSYPVPVGQPHPDFQLPSVEEGSPIRLSDYRGKKVVLIHFASW